MALRDTSIAQLSCDGAVLCCRAASVPVDKLFSTILTGGTHADAAILSCQKRKV